MLNFGERLKEEIESTGINAKILSESIDIPVMMIYEWCRNENKPNLNHLVKLAEYFKCSIDYLMDREPKYENIVFKKRPLFANHFKELIKKQNAKIYAISKATGIGRPRLYDWKNGVSEPQLENLVKVADYLKITIDVLIGRQ